MENINEQNIESNIEQGNLDEIFDSRVEIDLSLKAQVEAIIFASPKPVLIPDIISYLPNPYTPSEVEAAVFELQSEYEERKGGFILDYFKGIGYQFRTVSEVAPIMEAMFSTRPKQLSKAALETLVIIAYRQPTTRAVVEYVRGVDSGSIIKNLMDKNLIKCVGRKEDIGRPMLFGTTDEFLQVFGISSLSELPSLQSFQVSSEVLEAANKDLESLESGVTSVEVEGIVGDGSEVEVSDGLLAEEKEDSTENSEVNIEGASVYGDIDIDEDETETETENNDGIDEDVVGFDSDDSNDDEIDSDTDKD